MGLGEGPGWSLGRGLTHLTCRPSCCTPRAASSDTPSTPAWWAPRRRTPPGPRWQTCGQERRLALNLWCLPHPAPLPGQAAPRCS